LTQINATCREFPEHSTGWRSLRAVSPDSVACRVETKKEAAVNDFDLAGAAPEAATIVVLSHLTVAFAVLFYFAAAVLVCGLAVQTLRLLDANRGSIVGAFRMRGGFGAWAGQAFRAGTDVFLLRTTFYADRWAWIFGAAFHFGLLLILARHLRYFLDPSWVGPVWKLVELVQPFGFYGGIALPLGAGAWWIRQVVMRRGRVLAGWPDHAVMALLVAIPLVGYVNTLVHTDVVAVKAFMVGLMTLHWQPLPADPVLLVHLWLVLVLMVLLPFSRVLLLLPFGHLLQLTPVGTPPGTARARILAAIAPMLALVLLVPVAIGARQVVTGGFAQPKTDLASLVAEHRMDDPTVMIRNHPRFLFSHREIVVHQGQDAGQEAAAGNLERCVTCHVTKDGGGQPVGFNDPSHFCRGCHNKAAVTIDCFECHRSKPSPAGQAAADTPSRFAAAIAPDSDRSAPQ
jgi:nitrate reductase gamma subunit